jgi:hypothetical protein
VLGIFWAVYVAMVVGSVVTRDPPLVFFTCAWSVGLPWISWALLSGVRIEPGRRIGGGPMYPRVELEPDEEVVFNAPAHERRSLSGAHLFVTNKRVIVLPISGGIIPGHATKIPLNAIQSVDSTSNGFGWPYAKQRIRITFDRSTVELRPWAGPHFMGLISGDEFAKGVMTALEALGVQVRRKDEEI